MVMYSFHRPYMLGFKQSSEYEQEQIITVVITPLHLILIAYTYSSYPRQGVCLLFLSLSNQKREIP